MHIGKGNHGKNPSISGANFKGTYIAEELHFHWGSSAIFGSEHRIDGKRFDIEMHIVHRHQKYLSLVEAADYSDGVAVIGVMISIVRDKYETYPVSNVVNLFEKLAFIQKYKTITYLPEYFTLGSMLKDLNTQYFYTYMGSLTTPNCNENVHWIVFQKPIRVPPNPTFKLFQLKNIKKLPILYNFRKIQNLNSRTIRFSLELFCHDQQSEECSSLKIK
ncbi:carbonic anhydrase 6-like [Drosophila innubila]|uniref:carbonic anhydrase 6-like n=1 Tax=Drosophila innubila TaxID=198719 RepID=UPI00148E22F4|nr:carbonic anhydrase 6-like [Drosophila innubila]